MTKTHPFTADDLDQIVQASVVAARTGERVIREGASRRDFIEWKTKAPADYVSEIDLRAEEAIRKSLASGVKSPWEIGRNFSVLGEEAWDASEKLPDGLVFIVDPLDGTTNFLHGLPQYAVSIAALYDGEPVTGVVADATRGETFSATLGHGARLNGKEIKVSSITLPERALIGTGIPFGGNADIVRYASQLAAVAVATAGIRRCGSAAIDLAWIAAGRLDAFWELSIKPWDIAAGILLIKEAGGVVTGTNGQATDIFTSPIVAGNPTMHEWLLKTINDADASSQQ